MKLASVRLLLVAFCTLGVFNGAPRGMVLGQRCLPTLPTLTPPPPPHERRCLPQKKQFLVPRYSFGCYGQLVRWEARVQGMNPTVIRFQVWRRRRRGSGYFDVVGENIYPGYDAVKHIVVFDVNEADRISVQPGDIIGAYVEAEGDRDDYKMVLHESSLYDSVQVYLIEVEDQLVESFSFSRDPLSDNPPFGVINGSAPLLRATVEAGKMKVLPSSPAVAPTQTTSGHTSRAIHTAAIATSPTPKLPEEMNNGGNSSNAPTKLIIGIGLSTGVLVLCFCAFIVMAALYARVRHIYKRRRMGLNRASRSDSERYPSILTLLPSRETLTSLNNSAPTSLTNSFNADGHMLQSTTSFQPSHPPPSPPPPPPPPLATAADLVSSLEAKPQTGSADESSSQQRDAASLIKLRENPCYSPLPAAPVYDITHHGGSSGKHGAMQNAFDDKKQPRSGTGGGVEKETDDGRVYDLPVVLNKKVKPFEYEVPTANPGDTPQENNDHVYAEIH